VAVYYFTYGGINVFVAIFVIVPIARGLFKKLNIPWHLFMIPFAWGGATITMTMIPGTPQIQNLIPMAYLGTTPMAGASIGIIAAVVTSALIYWYMTRALRACESAGEGYMTGEGYVTVGNSQQPATEVATATEKTLPNGWLALLPPVSALLSMNLLKWDPFYAISLATVLAIALFWKKADCYTAASSPHQLVGCVPERGQLLRDSDVLVEGFRPGVMGKLAFDKDEIHRINSKIIICSISG